MPKIKDLVEIMNKIAPEQYVYEYDNVGLLIGDENAELKRIICCLDVTEEIINEARENHAQLIISHHPIIFQPIKNITTADSQGRKIINALKNDISIYSAHTNLDFVRNGINEHVSYLIGLTDMKPLDPYISDTQGFGRVGKLSNEITCYDLKKKVMKLLNDEHVIAIGNCNKRINKVAVINGAGGGSIEYVDMAIRAGADCLITAEVKHHVAIYAFENNIAIIEPQHYTMEHIYISYLAERLKIETAKNGISLDINVSEKEINPIF